MAAANGIPNGKPEEWTEEQLEEALEKLKVLHIKVSPSLCWCLCDRNSRDRAIYAIPES